MRYSLKAGMGATLCLRCWVCLTACSPSVVPMACWNSKYSAGLPPFEQTSHLSTRCGFSSVRIVSSGAIHHSKCQMMQACFALVPQDNAARAFRSPRVRASASSLLALWAGFFAFKVSRRIPISTFGHSNACCQSRRADCGLSHACLRSSAACAFNGVLCVLDGFVMKCPKVETMYLDGVEIPGSVNFSGGRSRFCGAQGSFLWCAESVLVVRGVSFDCSRPRRALLPGERRANMPAGDDDQIYLRGSEEQKKTPRRAPCMQISSQEGERRVCDASALRSGPPCRT